MALESLSKQDGIQDPLGAVDMEEVSLQISSFVMTWSFCMDETSVFHILLAFKTAIAYSSFI